MSEYRAFPLSLVAAVSALCLSGCMGRSGPVAAVPHSELDALAYGGPLEAAQPTPALRRASPGFASGGGALAALGRSLSSSRNSVTRVAEARSPDLPPAPDVAVTADQPASEASATAAPPEPVLRQRGLFTGANFGRSPRRAPVMPVAYGRPAPVVMTHDPDYRLDAGDKLRVVVYGQEGLTNTYAIDAGGAITLPLIGAVQARGKTPAALAALITTRLRDGFIRDPSVAVEIESYRPFFILGEVTAPGQYPYVPNLSVESAVAIAGGFSPRARRDAVTVTHPVQDGVLRAVVPLGTPINPGDTIMVGERWF